jgi:nucleotide-binding universal stress UspA family protein
VPGGVAEHLLHGAPCPIVVVPTGAPAVTRTIGVAYDGRKESELALAAARDLGGRLAARLVLLSVYNPMPVIAPGVGVVDWSDDIRRSLEEQVRALAKDAGADTRLLTGSPGVALVEACRSGIDLLVCGSRGYGPVRSALVGSVSRHVADHAPCPVMVVPRGVTGAEHELGTHVAATGAAG